MGLVADLERYRTAWLQPPPGFTGKAVFAGIWRGLRFIVTEDHDGQVEVSLSRPGPMPPTGGQEKAFLRAFGIVPAERTPRATMTHWVAIRGRLQ